MEWDVKEGRLEWREVGSGSEPVMVIFCLGGAGRDDDEEDDEESDSPPSSCLGD